MFYFSFVKFCAVEMFKCIITAFIENDNEWLYFPKRSAFSHRWTKKKLISVCANHWAREWKSKRIVHGNVASNRLLFHRLKTAIFHNDGSGFYNKRLCECHSQLSHIQVFIIWYTFSLSLPTKFPIFIDIKHSFIKRFNYSIPFHSNYVNFQAH